MPYSHLRWMAKERLESTTRQRMTTNCFSDLASAERPDPDFSELVWENGQILMQGQPSKARKGSSNTNTQEKEQDRALPNPKTAHSVLMNDNSTRHLGLANDDELGHWLDYPLDEYSSQFFSEFNQNFAVPVVKDGKDAHPCSSHSVPTNRSKLVDSTGCNTNIDQQPHCEKSNNVPLNSKLQTQPSKNVGVLNFSHFLRSAPITKTNRQNVDGASGSSSLGIDKARINDKGAVASCSNHVQSTIVSTIDSRSPTVLGSKLNTNTSDVRPPVAVPPMETLTIESSHTDNHGDAFEKSKAPDQAQTLSFAASTPVGRPEKEKYVEPVVTPSSVCSGNVTSGASDDMSNRFKRKYRETEESDYPSEDVEEDSVVVRKPVTARGGSSAKRTRAAEVHNLSERRRRDRINEKMRALQELIPNCNKVDKASMLDEAIEYLKTLQLQVQIMSMGTGLFMPPMVLPHGMQHLNAPHLTPFSPVNAGMGMGMGMGMNFGMGMVDFSGGSSGCPLIQMPPIHGQQFPYAPMSGPSSFPHMAGSNLQMFGPPGRGFPMSMPRAPFIPPPGGVSLKPNSLPVVSGVATPTEVPNLANPSCSKDPEENMNESVPNTNAEFSQDQMPSQGAKESFGLPVVKQRHDQPPQSSGNIVIDTA